MAKSKKPRPSRERVRAFRDRMRAKGMKQITFWVPDVTSPEFKAEAERQCRLIADSPGEKEDLAFIESLFDDPEFQQSLGGVPEYDEEG